MSWIDLDVFHRLAVRLHQHRNLFSHHIVYMVHILDRHLYTPYYGRREAICFPPSTSNPSFDLEFLDSLNLELDNRDMESYAFNKRVLSELARDDIVTYYISERCKTTGLLLLKTTHFHYVLELCKLVISTWAIIIRYQPTTSIDVKVRQKISK